MHGFGATPVIGITSVTQCQAACLSDSSCVAVDYDPYNTEKEYCWLLGGNYLSGPAPGITHYILDRNCMGKSQYLSP